MNVRYFGLSALLVNLSETDCCEDSVVSNKEPRFYVYILLSASVHLTSALRSSDFCLVRYGLDYATGRQSRNSSVINAYYLNQINNF
jgi:hypothetical protein